MNEEFKHTPEDLKDREDLERVLEIMERRCTAGETQPGDYASAIARRDYEIRKGEKLGQFETVNLLDRADGIFFDWDGVLNDSMKRICLGVFELIKRLAKENLRNISEEDVFNSFNAPFWDYYRRFGIPVETEADKKIVFDYYRNIIRPQLSQRLLKDDSLFPNTAENITWLYETGKNKNQNFKLGIISAGDEVIIRDVLARNKLANFFEFVRGSQHEKAPAITEAVRACNFNPERVLYIGDLPSDITDVQKTGSGVKTVALARFEKAEARLESYGPDFMIKGLSKNDLKTAKMYT